MMMHGMYVFVKNSHYKLDMLKSVIIGHFISMNSLRVPMGPQDFLH